MDADVVIGGDGCSRGRGSVAANAGVRGILGRGGGGGDGGGRGGGGGSGMGHRHGRSESNEC